MKIALICPSNMLYMPYVKYYEQILIENRIDYDIINWDRFGTEETSENIFKDKKVGHQRNYFDYLKYKKFLLKRLNTLEYEKIIVFGIQLTYMLKTILLNNYKDNYLIDIRDHNSIVKYFKSLSDVIESSEFVVLSSAGFKEFLPKSNKYIVNHNIHIGSLDELKQIDYPLNYKKLCISYIGAPRDLLVNIKLINALKNNATFDLYFHGEGEINKDILKYSKENSIENVFITGRYEKENEVGLFEKSDLINVLRYNDGVNNKVAMPNRLYNAVVNGKPLLALDGTYLAEEITRYNIGLVIRSFDTIEQDILTYFEQFDKDKYIEGQEIFIKKVIEENILFKVNLIKFIRFTVRSL